jgi:hypothetical protein
MFKVQVMVVYKLVKDDVAAGFAGPFGYSGPVFADGNNFNLPTPKL